MRHHLTGIPDKPLNVFQQTATSLCTQISLQEKKNRYHSSHLTGTVIRKYLLSFICPARRTTIKGRRDARGGNWKSDPVATGSFDPESPSLISPSGILTSRIWPPFCRQHYLLCFPIQTCQAAKVLGLDKALLDKTNISLTICPQVLQMFHLK